MDGAADQLLTWIGSLDWGVILTFTIIIGLLFLSGFFSGSETALTAASRARMHQLEQEGDKRAVIVNKLRENKENLIGAILLGNNLVNILASALATSVLIVLVGEAAVPIATVVMTLLVVIFAEVLPKTYAINNADKMALAIGPILRVVERVFSPVTNTIVLLVNASLRALGAHIDRATMADYVDELRGAIELHRGPEQETRHERAMLRSILDLTKVEVSEIMTHRRNLVAIDADQPTRDIIDSVLESPYTRIPLFQDDPDNIIGVLHAKDVLRALLSHRADLDTLDPRSIATKPWFIPDTTSLLDQLQNFRARREHFALVVDEYGSLQGVVTLEDILEEIVGDISDEHDVPVAGVRPQPNGSFIIDGTVTIRDLNRRFEWRLPDARASTLAGFVLHEAQRIPEVGQTFTFYGFRFEILRRQRHQITSIRVTPPQQLSDRRAEPQRSAEPA